MFSSVDSLSAICYGLGLLGFLAFSCQLALRPKGNWRTRVLVTASVLTAVWEFVGLADAWRPTAAPSLFYTLADSVRSGAWLVLLEALMPRVGVRDDSELPWRRGGGFWLPLGLTAVLSIAALTAGEEV